MLVLVARTWYSRWKAWKYVLLASSRILTTFWMRSLLSCSWMAFRLAARSDQKSSSVRGPGYAPGPCRKHAAGSPAVTWQ